MSESLLTRVGAGDGSALKDCIQKHAGLVWSMARRMSRSRGDAEDAVQEIFIEIWRHAARYDESKGSEGSFIATIARRRLIDRLRSATNDPIVRSGVDVCDLAEAEDEFTGTQNFLDAERAMAALATLRPLQRQIVELCFLRGMSHGQIAESLVIPLGTVKSLIRRGLLLVRQALTAESVTPVSTAPLRIHALTIDLLIGTPALAIDAE